MYEKLIEYLEHGQYKKAKVYIEKELSDSPDNVYLLTQMAFVLWKQKKMELALEYATMAETVDADDPLLLYTTGKILESADRFDEAIIRWDRILDQNIECFAKRCQGVNNALSMQNDARYYKAHCLYCKHSDEEADALLKIHIAHRRRGLESDFNIREVRAFAKILKYSSKTFQPSIIDDSVGYATIEQRHRIQDHIFKLEKSKDWEPLKNYLKRKCREFPKEYWLRTKMAEYLYQVKDKLCLRYAKEAYLMASDDMLVVYNYACALYLNGDYDKAMACLNVIITKGIDYIAYSEHGEGMRWAKSLLADTKKLISLCKDSAKNNGFGSL